MPNALFGKTWKMAPAASVFSSSFKPNVETRVYEERENGYKLTVSGSSNGRNYQWWYEAYQDGRPYPVHGRDDVSRITVYRLSDTDTVGFFEKETGPGQFVPGGPYARHLVADGKTLIVEAAGRHVDGSPFYDVITYGL